MVVDIKDSLGPSSRTRSRSAFGPYNITSYPSPKASLPPASVSVGIDVADLLKASVHAETQKLDDDGEDADGMDVSSDPVPQEHGLTSCLRIHRRQPVRKSTGANVATRYPHTVPHPDDAAPTSIQCGPASMSTDRPTRPRTRSLADKARVKLSSKVRRRSIRVETAQTNHGGLNYKPRGRASRRHVLASVITSVNAQGLPHSRTGYTGTRDRPADKDGRIWTREELLADGFRFIIWDGITTTVIVDAEDRIVAILAGRPDDPEWLPLIQEGFVFMKDVGGCGVDASHLKPDDVNHRRGAFVAMASGVSYGGGQRIPGNLVHTKAQREILDKLLDHASIIRIAGFQSSMFAEYSPKWYEAYVAKLSKLFVSIPTLCHNFHNSVFPAVTFNCGPCTIALRHLDTGNVAGGLCAITALGDFDSKTSAHLVLFPFKLMIEFPSGSTALIPSATVHHANTALQPGETRCSVTQYCAGGLFRWVDYGYKSAKSLLAEEDGKEKKRVVDGKDGERWTRSLGLFSKLTSLAADRTKVFKVSGSS